MQKKSFIYWLFSKDKKPLYVNDSGIIQEADGSTFLKPDGKPAHLKYSPDGWKDTLVKFGRNIKYWGLFREFTVPMKFKADGAKIVKNEMWNKGIEAIVYLAVSKLNRTIFPDKYEPWYSGELDFSKFVQKRNDVSINVMEGGLSKLLKAYEGTTYEIPVDADPDAVNILMDGLLFTNKISYIFLDADYYGGRNATAGTWTYAGLALVGQEGSTQGVLNQDQPQRSHTGFPNDFWFMHSESKDISVTISGSFKFSLNQSLTGNVHIYLEKVRNGISIAAFTLHNAPHAARTKFIVAFNQAITLAPSDKLYLVIRTPYSAFLGYNITEGTLDVGYNVRFSPSIIKSLTPLRLFQEIVKKLTAGKYVAHSSFLASLNDDILLTSGSAIRNHEGDIVHTASGSVIKTSLDEFFRAFRRSGIGLGIENDVLIIEKIEYFFKNDIILELGEIDDMEIVFAEDLAFNTIKVGYANQTYDEVNGKDEFNVTQSYTTPHTRVVRELDLVSPYRADMYGIELTRLNLYGRDSTDNSADNDTFFLSINNKVSASYTGSIIITDYPSLFKINAVGLNIQPKENLVVIDSLLNTREFVIMYVLEPATAPGTTEIQVYGDVIPEKITGTITVFSKLLNRPPYFSVSGLLHPAEAFNIELSPKRTLLNNGPFIRSVMDKQDMNFIKFQSGEKNSELSTTLSSIAISVHNTVTEKADVMIAELGDKLFLPYYFNFKTQVPINFTALIKSKPYGKIGFTNKGTKYYGFLFDGGIKPATNDAMQFKLLSAPDNDMTKLINE